MKKVLWGLALFVSGVGVGLFVNWIEPGLGWPAVAGLYFGMALPE